MKPVPAIQHHFPKINLNTGIPRYITLHLALFRNSKLLSTPEEVQYYAVDSSFWTLTFLCNSVSAVSISALFLWNQLTALSEGYLYYTPLYS
jgi:hypothetical protein